MCVQLDDTWRRSSFSAREGACMEVRQREGGVVEVRDSKVGDTGPVLTFEPKAWSEFTACVAIGAFSAAVLTGEWLAPGELGAWAGCPEVCLVGDTVYLRSRTTGDEAILLFTRYEWDAFEAGVESGEFTASTL